MKSFQNLMLLQNLYRQKILGFEYCDIFDINKKTIFDNPKNFDELYLNISKCHLCDLSKSRTQSMAGYGSKEAKIMFIDYAVSTNQDAQNNYYAGKSGEMLQKMINNVLKLNIEDVYFTHLIKCKPIKQDAISASEINSCKNYLLSQIDFIKPKIIVALGKEAYVKVTNEKDFENARGHMIDFKAYKMIPIYHPNHLLRNPKLKPITLNDLKTIKSYL